jgi:hypothetical protein
MKSNKPPKAATWLLQRLGNEALTGDLLEAWRQGRSSSWYRRQVAVAVMVAIARKLRMASPAMVYAALWSVAGAFLIFNDGFWLWFWRTFDLARAWCFRQPWPVSTISEIALSIAPQVLLLIVALGLFQTWQRGLSPGRMVRGALTGVLAIFFGPIVIISTGPYPTWSRRLLAALPIFCALLMAIWTVSIGEKPATRIPA